MTSVSWNYRILAGSDRVGGFEIREVYYDADGAPQMDGPAGLYGDKLVDLKWTLAKIEEAFTKPILTEADFPAPRNT